MKTILSLILCTLAQGCASDAQILAMFAIKPDGAGGVALQEGPYPTSITGEKQ